MVLLVIGFLIIAYNFWDFFHTTLSSNGFGKLTGRLNKQFSRFILWIGKRWFYKFSGLFHLLFSFLIWLILLVVGSYLLFLSSEKMVINADTNVAAGLLERFYYTCFTLTTLGIGDFVPGNDTSRIITSIVGVSGFVMLTTGISYLISIINGVVNKKNLASYINGMGSDINDLYLYAEVKNKESNIVKNASQLRGMLTSYTSQYWSLPIIHYFFTVRKEFSVAVQIAKLYEVLNVLSNNFEDETMEKQEIKSLQNAIDYFLSLSLHKESRYQFDEDKLREYRKGWDKYNVEIKHNHRKDKEIDALLKSCGWNWNSVYE